MTQLAADVHALRAELRVVRRKPVVDVDDRRRDVPRRRVGDEPWPQIRVLRVRIEVRRRLGDAKALRDRRRDADRYGPGKGEVRLVLEHLHVEPGIGERLFHVFRDAGSAGEHTDMWG